jgi:hypothetical protein
VQPLLDAFDQLMAAANYEEAAVMFGVYPIDDTTKKLFLR